MVIVWFIGGLAFGGLSGYLRCKIAHLNALKRVLDNVASSEEMSAFDAVRLMLKEIR